MNNPNPYSGEVRYGRDVVSLMLRFNNIIGSGITFSGGIILKPVIQWLHADIPLRADGYDYSPFPSNRVLIDCSIVVPLSAEPQDMEDVPYVAWRDYPIDAADGSEPFYSNGEVYRRGLQLEGFNNQSGVWGPDDYELSLSGVEQYNEFTDTWKLIGYVAPYYRHYRSEWDSDDEKFYMYAYPLPENGVGASIRYTGMPTNRYARWDMLTGDIETQSTPFDNQPDIPLTGTTGHAGDLGGRNYRGEGSTYPYTTADVVHRIGVAHCNDVNTQTLNKKTWFKFLRDQTKTSIGQTPSLEDLSTTNNPPEETDTLVCGDTIKQIRDALPLLASLHKNAITGNNFTFLGVSDDNFYYVAMGDRTDYGATGGAKYTWTRTLEQMEDTKTFDIDIGELHECISLIEGSDAAPLCPGHLPLLSEWVDDGWGTW